MSYNYSVWYVPIDSDNLRTKYGIKHIPHITIASNLSDVEKAIEICSRFPLNANFYFTQPATLVKFPSLYGNDPLSAVGFYARLFDEAEKDINLGFPAHMSVEYFAHGTKPKTQILQHDDNIIWKCRKTVVNTISDDSMNWFLLN